MWAQLIKMRVKPGADTAELSKQIRAAEQPGSGLVRSILMRDQTDPSRVYTLVVFESEEKARAREQDPRRQERLQNRAGDHGRHLRRPAGVHRPDGRSKSGRTQDERAPERSGRPIGVRRGGSEEISPPSPASSTTDIVWHESTPGFEGDYHGSEAALALLGRVFEETGMELIDISINHVLADDGHAVVLLASTMSLGDRRHTGDYVDVYRAARREVDRALAPCRRPEGRREVLRRLTPRRARFGSGTSRAARLEQGSDGTWQSS